MVNLRQLDQDGNYEFVLTGPFGGHQSDMPNSAIGDSDGFSFTDNVIFRQGIIANRGSLTQKHTLAIGTTRIEAIAPFYDSLGRRKVMYAGTLNAGADLDIYAWDGTTLTNMLTLVGAGSRIVSCDTVNDILSFSNGKFQLRNWDGTAADVPTVNALAPSARHLCEIANHLLCGYVDTDPITGGGPFPQRIRWSAEGDPTDYNVSLTAGFVDLSNNLGPIRGIHRVGQLGLVLQEKGFVQIAPTGNGLNPFDFVSFGDSSHGNHFSYSHAAFGNEFVIYVNNSNVWKFDGTSFEPIGSKPIDGNRRRGARTAILRDLSGITSEETVVGFCSYDILTQEYTGYWLCSGENTVWYYDFIEQAWSRLTYNKNISCIGNTFLADLVTYPQYDIRGCTPFLGNGNTILKGNVFVNSNDDFLAFGAGAFIYLNNPNDPTVTDGGSIGILQSGTLYLGDTKKNKVISQLRIQYRNLYVNDLIFDIYNEKGSHVSGELTSTGTTGTSLSHIFPVKLSGLNFGYQIQANNAKGFMIEEIGIKFKYESDYKNN